MMISENLLRRIQKIESKVKRIDRDVNYSNTYSLNSMKEHVEEIKELFNESNEHWKDETIDLLIHCLLFLNRNGCRKEDMDSIVDKRIKRFVEKISARIEDLDI